MLTALAILALVFAAAAARAQSQSDNDNAWRDLEANYPNIDDRQYIFYVTMFPWVGEDATQLKQAIKLMIASDSVQPVIERCAGVDVGNGLLRYDTRDLRWRLKDWITVSYKRNPYVSEVPLVVRGDWLLVELSDQVESNSYVLLPFHGDNLPKNRDDILKFFRIGNEPDYAVVEGKSGVSVQGTRRIESRPKLGEGFLFRTEDVRELTNERDAAEHPGGGAPFDAEEGIPSLFKQSNTTGQRCLLQFYYLADGRGILLDRADPDIVKDHTHFRNNDDIHNPGSCIQCHAEGLKQPTQNLIRAFQKGKILIYPKGVSTDLFESLLLADVTKPIGRFQDDFQTAVELTTGAKSNVAAESFKQAVLRYDAPLPLGQVARELDITVDELVHALAVNGTISARLSAIAADLPGAEGGIEHGTLPRRAMEQDVIKLYDATHGGPPIKVEQAKPVVKPKSAPSAPKQQQNNRRKAA